MLATIIFTVIGVHVAYALVIVGWFYLATREAKPRVRIVR